VVRNLPRDYNNDALANLFANFAGVTKARMGRGLGRVHFAEAEEAQVALNGVNGTSVGDRVLVVEHEYARVSRPRASGGDAAAPRAAAPRAPRAPRETTSEPRVAAPPRRVRVDGLVDGTTADHLKAAFATVGRITAAKTVQPNPEVAGSALHGFVTFEDDVAANKAVSLSGTQLHGAVLAVSLDRGRAPRAPRVRGDGAGETGAGRRRKADDEGEAAPAPAKHVNTVWVGGVAEGVDEATLRGFFGRFGSIESINVLRGFAYIKFANASSMTAAIEGANGVELGGRVVAVEEASGGAVRARRPRRRAGPRA